MARIRLVAGAATDIEGRAGKLRAAGYEVQADPIGPQVLKGMRRSPPAAMVIDLEHGFSMGRDVALWLRSAKATRAVPIVLVDGAPEKLERLKTQLPDATYTTWRRIRSALAKAIAHPPEDPVRPASVLAGYSGTPLPKKLGIKPGAVLALLGAPDGFIDSTLGPLPDDVEIRTDLRKAPHLIVWFARSCGEVERRIERMADRVGRDGLWIAWQKKAAGTFSDLTQADVRRIGLANGLVDYKVCAIDEVWSGLKFARRPPRGNTEPGLR